MRPGLTSYWSVQMRARWPPLLQAHIKLPESIESIGGGEHTGLPDHRTDASTARLDVLREAEVWWGRGAQLRSLFRSPYFKTQCGNGETASR